MGALSADFKTKYREGIEVDYPVKTTTKIYSGALVCVDNLGLAIPGADGANNKFVGVALEMVNNLGADGAKSIRVRRRGVFLFNATSIAQADVGKNMYLVNDNEFDESNPGVGVICGRLQKFVSSGQGWLSIDEATFVQALPGSADALTVSDAGDFFPAATDTVPEQIQALAGDLVPIIIPRQTGWVKDGTDKQALGPKLELNYPCRIKRAYGYLATVPGADKTLLVKFGATTMLTFGAADAYQEGEALDIAVAANTDLLSAAGGVLLNETAAGAGDDLDMYFLVARDDGV
jgi:hypothetical protein